MLARKSPHAILFIALPLIFSACQQGTSQEYDEDLEIGGYIERALDGEYAGDAVLILTPFNQADLTAFEDSLAGFTEETGIEITVQSGLDIESQVRAGIDSGNPPDIAGLRQLRTAREFAQDGTSVDVGTFLSQEYLREQYSDDLIDLASVDGRVSGVWYEVQVDSLVWYPKPEFEDNGYAIPETWDEMVDLMDTMVSDGITPWCVGMQSALTTGWVAADWLEEIVLRNSGPDVYDQWVTNETAFSSPEIVRGAQFLGSVWFENDYIQGGTTAIIDRSFDAAVQPMFLDNPLCYMYQMGWLITASFPEDVVIGEDVDFFYLPPIKPDEFPKPVMGTGQVFTAHSTEPAVLAVMEYLTTAESVRGLVEAGEYVAPHADTDMAWYPTDVDRRVAEIFYNASSFRYDATDLMPAEVGSGRVHLAMAEFVSTQTTTNIEEIFERIDDIWPTE